MTSYSAQRSLAAMVLLLAANSVSAATITVNSTSDAVANDGHCTLREAINSANNNVASGGMSGECAAGQAAPVIDTIAFNVPGTGVHTFNPSATLQIQEVVKIDGYTQPGSSVAKAFRQDNDRSSGRAYIEMFYNTRRQHGHNNGLSGRVRKAVFTARLLGV